jgi:hypothetical protein
MMKRCLLVLFLVLVTTPAWAGSYLDRAGLLVVEANRAGALLRERSSDRELARMIHQIAEARLSAAKTMLVPKEVALAHPHLLLLLEIYERAAAAACEADTARVIALILKAEEEDRILRRILSQLGWSMPKLSS